MFELADSYLDKLQNSREVSSEERRKIRQSIQNLSNLLNYPALDLSHWHEFFKVLVSAGYRSGKLITSKTGLLYTYALYLIGKIDFHVDPYDLRKTIARWFFMVSLTGRYTDSPETRMEQGLASLRDIGDAESFLALLDRIVTDTFTEDYWNITLPNELATSSSQSPSLFAYYAALNLLDARVLFSNMKVSELLDPALNPKKTPIERHHLFPEGYLTKTGVTQRRDANQIANYALVEWPDNIGISDKSPAEYFPQYTTRLSSDELDSMRFWHALPEGWEHMEYRQFLEERRKLIAQVIRSGFEKLL